MQVAYGFSAVGLWFEALSSEGFAQLTSFLTLQASAPISLPEISFTALGVLSFVVPFAILWVVDLGYLYFSRELLAGENQGFRALLEGFNYFFKAILVRLITLILVVLGLFTFLVPGIFFLCAFSQTGFLLLDHPDKSISWLFLRSMQLMRGRIREYIRLHLSFLLWMLLALIPPIHYAVRTWYLPYLNITRAGYYNHISGKRPKDAQWQRPGMF